MRTRVLPRRRLLQRGVALAGIGLLCGCSLPFRPTTRVSRVGYLGGGATTSDLMDTFRRRLSELGHREGENLLIEYRFTDGRLDQGPALAAELVTLGVDLIVANGADAAVAAKNATATIPIVGMPLGADPVAAGLVASLARPGGNVTGLSTVGAGTVAKRLELLKETSGSISHVAILWNPGNAGKVTEFAEAQEAAPMLGLRLSSVTVRRDADFDGAFAAIAASDAEAMLVFQENLTIAHSARIAEFALRQRLPTIHELRDFADLGGLMSYGINRRDIWHRAADYADKVLKGTKPADLPVELPTVFDLVVNLKTAQLLGLTVPSSILQQATEVIS